MDFRKRELALDVELEVDIKYVPDPPLSQESLAFPNVPEGMIREWIRYVVEVGCRWLHISSAHWNRQSVRPTHKQ